MKIKSKLLSLNELNANGSSFSNNCKIAIPEMIPTAIVKRDDKGLIFTEDIPNQNKYTFKIIESEEL